MTKLFKISVVASLIIFSISLALLIVLYNAQNPTVTEVDDEYNSIIRVAVLNGCGREGLATMFTRIIRNIGYDVINGQGENADSFDFDISVVLDRRGNKEKAKKVQKDLGISELVDQYSANPYIIEDVVVILGRDWDTLKLSKEVVDD